MFTKEEQISQIYKRGKIINDDKIKEKNFFPKKELINKY